MSNDAPPHDDAPPPANANRQRRSSTGSSPTSDYQGRSRFGLRRKAFRPALPARTLLLAPSGAGKTWSALSIATELVAGTSGEIVCIDTEQQQGEHTASVTYADVFDFDLVPWHGGGFDVRDLTATLNDSARHMRPEDVLIVDGMQPFWSGVDGILDMVEGKFGSWAKVRPYQAAMMEAIKTHPSHVILTCRAKLQWSVEEVEDSHGRKKQHVEMKGVGPQFDQNIIYEMNVTLLGDQDHSWTVIKSRATKLADRTYRAEEERVFAAEYRDWLAAGQELADADAVAELVASINALPEADRKAVKLAFAEEFGTPGSILAVDLARAVEWTGHAVGERIAAVVSGTATDDPPATPAGSPDVAAPGVPRADHPAEPPKPPEGQSAPLSDPADDAPRLRALIRAEASALAEDAVAELGDYLRSEGWDLDAPIPREGLTRLTEHMAQFLDVDSWPPAAASGSGDEDPGPTEPPEPAKRAAGRRSGRAA